MAQRQSQHEMIVRPEKAHRLGHAEACPLLEGSKRLVGWVVGSRGCLFCVVLWLTACSQLMWAASKLMQEHR